MASRQIALPKLPPSLIGVFFLGIRTGANMKEFNGRVAVVTGAASGIGRGMAESFAAAGMKVVLSDIEPGALAQTTESLRAAGADVHAVVTDVSKAAQVEALAQAVIARYGQVHILCNNAGIGGGGLSNWGSSLDDWNWILGVNLMGVVHGIRSFLPLMIEQGTEAHIVNTASIAGLIVNTASLYGVTKAAVIALSEGLHLELLTRGARPRISVLCPGPVKTEILNSQRNRPMELSAPSPAPTSPVAAVVRDWMTREVDNGLDPRAVGEEVLAAIRSERFYILTHPEMSPMIEKRMTDILAGNNPTAVRPPNFDWAEQRIAALLEKPA
jgi:NAD(P)-dependent dehydrogenase (short-subunit alcohol dehydrogenase family)